MRSAKFLGGETPPHRFGLLASIVLILANGLAELRAQTGPGEGREGLVELGKTDERLKGHYAPRGIKVEIVAAEPTIIDPTGMAFADDGTLYVTEWRSSDRMYDTRDELKLPEGGNVRVTRRRKATVDIVKRLRDTNRDGIYDSAEVVVDGAEMPAAIFPWKNSLFLTCVGRLEKWTDTDGDGRFETRTILADGFCGFYHHWLSGMVLNADGWFYLTAGDNDNHVIGSDGSRVEVSRCGGVFRGRLDGSRMNFFAMGFRNPYRNLAFNATFDPFLVDNDNEDGSKFQGCRLINPVEGGDYGWRLMPGALCCVPDFDRGAVDGELPGKLPIVAKTGRGAPAGLMAYQGVGLPGDYRDLIIYPDVFRKMVRGYHVKPQGGASALADQAVLMTADDDLFRPCQAVEGADGAIYVLDWRSNSGGAGRLWGDGKYGRLYKLSWEGDGRIPAIPLKENNWNRVREADSKALLKMIGGNDFAEAKRAQRELVARGEASLASLLKLMRSPGKSDSNQARLLGLQGARQLWNEEVEAAMVAALDDPDPVVRRLAAQSLSWEPQERRPSLVPALVAHLNDPDGRALRDIALAIGRHGWSVPFDAAPTLLAWLLNHPREDVVTRDAFIRGLEALGEPGVKQIALTIRNGSKADRGQAVAIFSTLRTAPAAKILPSLIGLDQLTTAERLALVKLHKDMPLNVPVATHSLVEWVTSHPEADSSIKVAALDVCRLAGVPASKMVLALLDDRDEAVRLAATRAAAQSKPEGSVDRFLARVVDPKRSVAERTAAALALRGAGPQAFSALESAFKISENDPEFRKAALRALFESDREKARSIVEAALGDKSSLIQGEAIQVLGETPSTALSLGKLFVAGKVGRNALPAVLSALRNYGKSEEHRKLLAEIEESASQNMITASDIKAQYQKGADAWRGLGVYLREKGARCFTCHKIEALGGNVGPALTGVYQALSLDKLIESIIEPSREIKEGYESLKVALKDGRVLSGIRVSQDARTLVLKDANGQETRIAVDDIDEQAKDKVSLMPVGLVRDFSAEDLADLLAFLLSKPAQEVLRNSRRLDHFLAIGPFASGEDSKNVPLDRVDASHIYAGQDGEKRIWSSIDTNSFGYLNLEGQFGSPSSRAYLSVQVRSSLKQEAVLRFGLGGACRVYLNGAKVAEATPKWPVSLDSAMARLPLQAGWNTLVVAIDRPADDYRGDFEVLSPLPVETRAGK